MSTDEKALESNAEAEGTSDPSSVKTQSNTGQQPGPQTQEGSVANVSATTTDQQVNIPILIYLSFYLLNLKFVFSYIYIYMWVFPVLCSI